MPVIVDPDALAPQYFGRLSSLYVKPFILRAKVHPEDTVETECQFYDDQFLPDYQIPARVNQIQLIKGTALQVCRPSSALHVIEIGNGIFLSYNDYVNFNLLYHTNLIGEPEPYPTEFLVMREEDFTLVLPNGTEYRVTFAEAPQVEPIRLMKGEWAYTLKCKLRIVPDEDEQEEI